MSNFSIICLHVFNDCLVQYRKVLERGQYFFFNNWYELKNGEVVRKDDTVFERTFFGKNISIQAIVGKNGSGKSSILDLLYRLINNLSYVAVENKYRATATRLYYIRGLHAEFYFELEGKLGCVTCNNEEVRLRYDDTDERYHFSTDPESDEDAVNNVDKRTNSYSRALDIDERANEVLGSFFYSLALNYSIQGLNPQDYWSELACGDDKDDTPVDSWLDSIYDKNDGYLVPFGIEPYKGRNKIDLAVQKELTDSRVAVLLIDAKNRSKLEKKRIQFIKDYDLSDITFYLRDSCPDENDDDAMAEYEFLNKLISTPGCMRMEDFLEGYDIQRPIDLDNSNKLFEELMRYIIEKTFSIIEKYPAYENFHRVRDVFYGDLDINEEDEYAGEYSSMLRTAIEMIIEDDTHISTKIKQTVNMARAMQFKEELDDYLEGSFSYFDFIKDFYKKDSFASPKEVLEHYPPSIFEPEIYLKKSNNDGKDFKFTSLSSGERQLAVTSAAYLYHIRNIISVPKDDNVRISYRNINLFLDEIELCYHPEYQREFISNLIQSLKDNGVLDECNINILLTTHSPFVLSDIPKSNILFLRDGKVANDEITYDTFGANINDLLHKSFFLENGFSGSLAQERINDIAIQLTDSNTKGDVNLECIRKTIDVVGDPLLKHQLNILYDNYLRRFNIEEKQKRISELKEELHYLEQQ